MKKNIRNLFIRNLLFVLGLFTLNVGCDAYENSRIPELSAAEWLPGGEATNTLLLGSNAFLRPAQNLSDAHEQDFYSGNGFFNQGWVQAPASTKNRDGLGPLFNTRSCSGCHFKDGRAAPPEDGKTPFVGLLVRLSVKAGDAIVPHPLYGGQFQDQAIQGHLPEGSATIMNTEISGRYEDGEEYSLLKPVYIFDFQDNSYAEETLYSPRIAPHMLGLGLLEAIPAARLVALSDENDVDKDGISGKLQWHDLETPLIGRFGWKGDAPTIPDQVAGALSGDMGLSSPLIPADDCTEFQEICREADQGGKPEVGQKIFDLLVLYSRSVAVPIRRKADDETVRKGQQIFSDLKCTSCHIPSHITGTSALKEFENQKIWPYTDLLLHDMGEALADHRPLLRASGSEWKTPPLWGLGLIPEVNGHQRLLHDGRARGYAEAILWHGGEAEQARDAFKSLNKSGREALILFLRDL